MHEDSVDVATAQRRLGGRPQHAQLKDDGPKQPTIGHECLGFMARCD
jgi:hypothetical protein